MKSTGFVTITHTMAVLAFVKNQVCLKAVSTEHGAHDPILCHGLLNILPSCSLIRLCKRQDHAQTQCSAVCDKKNHDDRCVHHHHRNHAYALILGQDRQVHEWASYLCGELGCGHRGSAFARRDGPRSHDTVACVQSKHPASLSASSSVWPQWLDYRAQKEEKRSLALFTCNHFLVAFPHRKVGWGQAFINDTGSCMGLRLHRSVSVDKNHVFNRTWLFCLCVSCHLKSWNYFLHHQWLFDHCYHCITLSLHGLMLRVA